ncbi:MAG TPA: GNAT family N-acetyltransferase [Caulobacteraceae bacterium]|nr:GNAT family N-acetyltransferase [Caulobacteraceae bacterium]
MPPLDPDIEIRPMRRDEASAWRSLRLEMLKDHPTAFKSSYEEEAVQPLESFARRIFEDGVSVRFGVYAKGELCGSAGFEREPRAKTAHKGVLGGVYLKPALRGRGLGEALVQRVIDHARAHVAQLLCSVTSDNPSAKELYRRLGFVAYGTAPRALRYDGVDHNEDLLVLALD